MSLDKLPLLKPHQQKNQYGHRIYHPTEETYLSVGDYVEMPTFRGRVDAIRYGSRNQRQFSLDGYNRWFDEQRLIQRLSHKNYLWWNLH